MALKKKPVTGMKDILPAEMAIRDYVIRLIKETYGTFRFLIYRDSMRGAYRKPVEQTGWRKRKTDLQDFKKRRKTETGDCWNVKRIWWMEVFVMT